MDNPTYTGNTTNKDLGEEDFIIALFVVVFDTKRGNEIEWQIPEEVDLKGIEFKAIVSGSHNMSQDFIYFRHQQHYGLSCFALKSLESKEERGARMKSVGILCAKYTSLHEHQDFLELQVKQQLDQPGHYSQLTRYYIKYRHCPLQNNTFLGTPRKSVDGGFMGIEDLTVLKITHPVGCFSQFIRFFGEYIFVLWKFVLLQKRILFFAPPPAGVQCYRVYCTGLLGSNAFSHHIVHHLLFYVSLCSISTLTSLDSYVACTTEKILGTKFELYDLFINKENITCADEYLQSVARVNSADKARYSQLKKYSRQQLCINEDITNDEKMYTRFFIEQNNRIFKILLEISKRENNQVTTNHVREMGLSPTHDREFLSELIDLYNIQVTKLQPSCCC